MSFEHHSSDEQGARLVQLKGRIDSATAGAFELAVQDLFATPGARALLDFATSGLHLQRWPARGC